MRHSFAACFLSAIIAAFFMLSCDDTIKRPPPPPDLTLSHETMDFGSNSLAEQYSSVVCNTNWYTSSDQAWCTVSPASGNFNSNVTVTLEPNETALARTATITVKTIVGLPVQAKTITVTQYPAGDMADRITIEGSGASAKLVITRTPTDAGLFFKFGSVVGIYSGNHANTVLPGSSDDDAFDSGDIAFNPTATATYGTWDAVPYTNTETEINAKYHTLANVQAGKGDPCRLVGYTAQQIKAATTVPDNGIWRLPTNAENQAFSGQTENVATSVHWWDLAGGTNPSPFSGVAGGEFPSRGNGGAGKFLPAAGVRNTYGTVTGQGTLGYYWSSEPYNASNGYSLLFLASNVYPLTNAGFPAGLSVRCVRQ